MSRRPSGMGMVREEQPSADENGWNRSRARPLPTAHAVDDSAMSPRITPPSQTATAPKSLSTWLAYLKDKGAGGRNSRSWQSVQPWSEKKANGTRGIAKQPDGRSMRLHGGCQIAPNFNR